MIKKITIINIFAVLMIMNSGLFAQDPVFSQYYISPIHVNPGFAGVSGEGANIGVNYRMQWPGLPRAYNTFAISYDQYFESTKSAIGLRLITDSAGDGAVSSNKLAGTYAYRLKVGRKGFINGGIEFGFGQQSLNWDRFVFYDAIERSGGLTSPGGSYLPSIESQPPELTRVYLDISSGVLYYNESFFVGVGVAHINTPENKFLRNETNNYVGMPVRLSVQTGFQINLNKYNKAENPSFISPNLLVINQGPFTQVNVGAYMQLNQFITGMWYRHTPANGDALIFSFGVKYQNLRLAYSFDLTLSDLGLSPLGSHELGMVYNFQHKSKSSKLNDCLMLFR